MAPFEWGGHLHLLSRAQHLAAARGRRQRGRRPDMGVRATLERHGAVRQRQRQVEVVVEMRTRLLAQLSTLEQLFTTAGRGLESMSSSRTRVSPESAAPPDNLLHRPDSSGRAAASLMSGKTAKIVSSFRHAR